jgi:hypothetical protein
MPVASSSLPPDSIAHSKVTASRSTLALVVARKWLPAPRVFPHAIRRPGSRGLRSRGLPAWPRSAPHRAPISPRLPYAAAPDRSHAKRQRTDPPGPARHPWNAPPVMVGVRQAISSGRWRLVHDLGGQDRAAPQRAWRIAGVRHMLT